MADNKKVNELNAASSASDTDNVVLGVGALAKRLTIALLRTAILKLTALAAITTVALTEHILIDEAGVAKKMTLTNLKTVMSVPLPFLHVQDQKATTVDGGGSTGGAYAIRTLNTVVTNTITGASLASNKITLPAGTYDLEAACIVFGSNSTKALIWNDSDSAFILVGLSQFFRSTNDETANAARVSGRFTLAAEKNLELQNYIAVSRASDGLGTATDDGEIEVYADVQIRKVA